MTRQEFFVPSEYFKHCEHSSSSTKQVKPATQLHIMQNYEGHAWSREDCLYISFVFKTNYQGILMRSRREGN